LAFLVEGGTKEGQNGGMEDHISEKVSLLLVGACEQNRHTVHRMARSYGWEVVEAAGCQSAIECLRNARASVVLCEDDLADGDWKELLGEVETLDYRPRLVLASRFEHDGLWAEVLSRGVYDILLTPYAAEEMRRVVSLAWRETWEDRAAERKPPQPERGARKKKMRSASADGGRGDFWQG